jgi:hypothetical protein
MVLKWTVLTCLCRQHVRTSLNMPQCVPLGVNQVVGLVRFYLQYLDGHPGLEHYREVYAYKYWLTPYLYTYMFLSPKAVTCNPMVWNTIFYLFPVWGY